MLRISPIGVYLGVRIVVNVGIAPEALARIGVGNDEIDVRNLPAMGS